MSVKSQDMNTNIAMPSTALQETFGWLVFLIPLHLTAFVAATYGFGIYLFSALVPEMRQELGFDYTAIGVITGAAQAGFMLFAIGGAVLAHRIGGTMVAVMSAALCSICLALIPAFSSIIVVGALLTILGGCAASVYVPMVDIVSKSIDVAHRGKVLGLISSGTSYGVFLHGLLIPVFLVRGNWQAVWMVMAVVTLAITISAYFTLKQAGLLVKSDNVPASKPAAPKNSTGNFSLFSLRATETWVLVIWAMTFLNGFTTLPFQNFLSSYLRDELGYGVELNAQVWAMIGLIGMFSGFALGALSDRIGTRRTMVLTYLFLCLSATLLVFKPYEGIVLVAGVVFALAFYPIFGLVPAYIAKNPSKLSGTTIFAVANVALGVGGILGNVLAGVSKTSLGSFVWMYGVIAALSILLCVLTLFLPNEQRLAQPA